MGEKLFHSLKESFAKDFEKAKRIHQQKATGFEVCKFLSTSFDKVIKTYFGEIKGEFKKPVALYALGSYAREEVNLHSDIDITIISLGNFSKEEEKLLENFYYFLLSLRREIGFSPRTVGETIKLSQTEISVFTNILQRRFLCGDEEVEVELSKKFKKFVEENKKNISFELMAIRNERYKKFYGTVYYQEPNVKESKGGLRDLHEAFWISKVCLGTENYYGFLEKRLIDYQNFRDLISAYDFLLTVRNHLHFISGRKSDILSFEMQKIVAKHFGFEEDRKGVEKFLKNYFSSATEVAIISREIIRKSLEELEPKKKHFFVSSIPKNVPFVVEEGVVYPGKNLEELLAKTPSIAVDCFKIVQSKGAKLSPSLFSILRTFAHTYKDALRTKESMKKLGELLKTTNRLSYTLELMHDTRILGALIPDFERLRGHFQYDTYHKFTTDMHLILTVRELEKIKEKGTTTTSVKEKQSFYRILQDIENPHTLFISALFHDIGKGKRGKHENVGSVIAGRYLKEMNFSQEEISEVKWLIRNHLLMSKLAFRRDVSDPSLAESLKKECKTEDRLKKLFLLTYADIKAVGPGAWDKWKSALLWELFNTTISLFLQRKSAEELAEEKVKKRKNRVVELLSGTAQKEVLETFLKSGDRDYIITYRPEEIATHLKVIEELEKNDREFKLLSESHPDMGFTELTLITKYRRGLFSKVAGILAYLGINVRGACINKVMSLKDEYMVYTIQVSTISGEPIPQDKLEELKNYLTALYSGKKFPEPEKVKLKTFRKTLPLPQNKVKIDNKTSEKYTIVEVSTHDRLGILYKLTKALIEMNTRLRRAIITTEGNRVIDTFYITDIDYKKITDEEFLRKLKENLLSVISN